MIASLPAAHPELMALVVAAIVIASALGALATVRALGDQAWRAGWDFGPPDGAGSVTELESLPDGEPALERGVPRLPADDR